MGPMETGETTAIRFRRGKASAEAIEKVVQDVLAEIGVPGSESAKRAEPLTEDGVKLETLAQVPVFVEEEQQAFDATTTTIVIGVATGLATHISKELFDRFWDDVLWPRIKRRLGGDAVGDKIE